MKQNKNAKITDKKIETFVTNLMKENPVKFIQYALVVIGRDIFNSNAAEFEFSQESDLDNGRRFNITVNGTIKEVTQSY